MIFKNNSLLSLRLMLFVALSLTLIFVNAHSQRFNHWRNNLAVLVYPVQAIVNAPIHGLHDMTQSFTRQKSLVRENAQLRAKELMLQARLQRLLALEHENQQLKALLSSTSKVAGKVKVAQLLAVDLQPALQQMILDKGRRDSVYSGQPVLDAHGVVGQVVDVSPHTSRALLLTDERSAVPVEDARNGVRGIAVGTGSLEKLKIIDITKTSDVREGDLFVTSGLGLHFPVGYPVGSVSAVNPETSGRFLKIAVKTAAQFDQAQQVLLAWPEHAPLVKAVKKELAKPMPTLNPY